MEVTDNFTPSLPLPVPVSQGRNEIKSNVSINATTNNLKSTNNTSSNSNAKVMQLPTQYGTNYYGTDAKTSFAIHRWQVSLLVYKKNI